MSVISWSRHQLLSLSHHGPLAGQEVSWAFGNLVHFTCPWQSIRKLIAALSEKASSVSEGFFSLFLR